MDSQVHMMDRMHKYITICTISTSILPYVYTLNSICHSIGWILNSLYSLLVYSLYCLRCRGLSLVALHCYCLVLYKDHIYQLQMPQISTPKTTDIKSIYRHSIKSICIHSIDDRYQVHIYIECLSSTCLSSRVCICICIYVYACVY